MLRPPTEISAGRLGRDAARHCIRASQSRFGSAQKGNIGGTQSSKAQIHCLVQQG
jgi:hypothetical protein